MCALANHCYDEGRAQRRLWGGLSAEEEGRGSNRHASKRVAYNEEVLTYLENKAHAGAIEYEALLF